MTKEINSEIIQGIASEKESILAKLKEVEAKEIEAKRLARKQREVKDILPYMEKRGYTITDDLIKIMVDTLACKIDMREVIMSKYISMSKYIRLKAFTYQNGERFEGIVIDIKINNEGKGEFYIKNEEKGKGVWSETITLSK